MYVNMYKQRRINNRELFLALICFLAASFLWLAQARLEQSRLADRIAPEILRFHVLADSNSAKDQELKLKVKSFLLEKIYEESNARSKADVVAYLTAGQKRLEMETRQFIRAQGEDFPVSINIAWSSFPEKHYGDFSLPAGTYEAARVQIGEGRGRNWWCVLYPKICVTKDAVAVVPDASREEFKKFLSEEDYQKLQSRRPVIRLDFQLRSLLGKR